MEKSNPLDINQQRLIANQNFIIFGEDFARHPHALEHLLRPLFNDNRFIWVETIGLRSPRFSLYDGKRIISKISKWISPLNATSEALRVPENITIISPLMIPFNQFKLIRKFNQWMVTRAVKKTIKQNDWDELITITSVPNACDYIGHFDEKLKIYFCVDEFSLWPGLDKKMVEAMEKKLINKADMIIATSDNLALTKVKVNRTTPVITHGVEFEHFNIGAKKTVSPKYHLCYFGLFDERSDQDILLAISQEVTNSEIHIFGTAVCDTKKLKNQKNIIFHGAVNYLDLPLLIAEMDAFILPYHKNDLTHFINPLKLKEYLSTGRPVIASDLPEVVKMQEYLYVAKNTEEFVEHINQLKKPESDQIDREKIISYVKTNETWQAKAQLLSSIMRG